MSFGFVADLVIVGCFFAVVVFGIWRGCYCGLVVGCFTCVVGFLVALCGLL